MQVGPSIKVSVIEEHTHSIPDYEALTLKIYSNTLCVMYRPPHSNLAKFLAYLDEFLDFVSL